MIKRLFLGLLFPLLLFFPIISYAFDSGSTGADGAFSPTANVVLNCYSTVNHNGVFNFTTVNIPSGVTVSFKKDPNNDPVTILASGDVTIDGTIDVSGGVGGLAMTLGAGGPGGYDGGDGGRVGILGGWGLRGRGPGGGGGGSGAANNGYGRGNGAGGSYQGAGSNAYYGVNAGGTYGSASLTNLIGGSGGGGSSYYFYSYYGATYVGKSGGGGGGAILIISSGTLTVNGQILANGGQGGSGTSSSYGSGGGGGSGGAIKLIADTIAGNGNISAMGGNGGNGYSGDNGAAGGYGYIRLEYNHLLRTTNTNPWFSGDYIPSNATSFPAPSLSISSIGGVNVPALPKADFNYPDVTLPYGTQNPIPVTITAKNIPLGTTVTVKVSPSMNGDPTTVTSAPLDGTIDSSAATAQITLSNGKPFFITLSASYTITALNGNGPLYVEGEKVKEVRISSSLGAGSRVVYVTESGKEIPAKI